MKILIISLVALTFLLSGCSSEGPEIVNTPNPSSNDDEQPEYKTRVRVRNVSGMFGAIEFLKFDVKKVVLKSPTPWPEINFGEVNADQVTDYTTQWPVFTSPDFELTFEVDGETAVLAYSPTCGPGDPLEDGSYTYEIRGYRRITAETTYIVVVGIYLVNDETAEEAIQMPLHVIRK